MKRFATRLIAAVLVLSLGLAAGVSLAAPRGEHHGFFRDGMERMGHFAERAKESAGEYLGYGHRRGHH